MAAIRFARGALLHEGYRMPDDSLSDWLMTCIEGEGATLRDIIAYVDYRNHAILTYEEFQVASDTLAARGRLQRSKALLQFSDNPPARHKPLLFSREEFHTAVNEYLANDQ